MAEKKKRRTRKNTEPIEEADPIEEEVEEKADVIQEEAADPIEDEPQEVNQIEEPHPIEEEEPAAENSFLFHVYQNYTGVRFRRKQAAINGVPVKMFAGLAFPFIQGDL